MTLPLVLLAVLLTATISGFMGMGGGLILMGVYGLIFPIGIAMVLHGLTQLAANGSRAIIHRRHIYWPTLLPYIIGSAITYTLLYSAAFSTNKGLAFLILGLLPFLQFFSRFRLKLDGSRIKDSFFCGILVTGAQLIAGASGSMLDIFFVESKLSRHQVIATKATTQSLGHSLKVVFYAQMMSSTEFFAQVPPWFLAGCVAGATLGSWLGKFVLNLLSEAKFTLWNKRLILSLGIFYLYKGASLLGFLP